MTGSKSERATELEDRHAAFVSALGHELRSPLNAILGFIQLFELSAETPLSDGQRQAIRQVLSDGAQMVDILDRVSDLTKVKAGRLTPTPGRIDAAGPVATVMQAVAVRAERAEVTVSVEMPSPRPGVFADDAMLTAALEEIVANAVAFNRPGGSATIAVVGDGDRCRIEVSDTGVGVSEADVDVAFEPFGRIRYTGRRHQGPGLGLALARAYVEAMGGRIGLAARAGGGTTAWIDLPASGG